MTDLAAISRKFQKYTDDWICDKVLDAAQNGETKYTFLVDEKHKSVDDRRMFDALKTRFPDTKWLRMYTAKSQAKHVCEKSQCFQSHDSMGDHFMFLWTPEALDFERGTRQEWGINERGINTLTFITSDWRLINGKVPGRLF